MNRIEMEPIQLNLGAVYEEQPEGGWVAYLPGYPGVTTQGKTLEHAKAMLKDSLKTMVIYHVEEFKKDFQGGVGWDYVAKEGGPVF